MDDAYYLVVRGSKYLHLNSKSGPTWGGRNKAFHFCSMEAATQISCALTSSRAKITIVRCEEE